jgi:outer membrane autotransporter protein
MKKLAILAALTFAATTASAVEFGVRGTHTKDTLRDMGGVTIGQKFGAFGVEGAFDRSTGSRVSVNRYSVLGSVDVAKVAGMTVAAKIGGAYINPSKGNNGTALLVGVGASYPVTKNVSLVADYAYQKAEQSIRNFNGNTVSAGIKVSF